MNNKKNYKIINLPVSVDRVIRWKSDKWPNGPPDRAKGHLPVYK